MSILVAGIGNIFLGDDAFGVEVVQRLAHRPLPCGVRVADFGIRGFDLAQTLVDASDTVVVLVDALPRGGDPGTLYLLEPGIDDSTPEIETHGMDPANVLRLVRAFGGQPPRILVVGCEPSTTELDPQGQIGLSPPVEAAVEEAIRLIADVVTTTEGSRT